MAKAAAETARFVEGGSGGLSGQEIEIEAEEPEGREPAEQRAVILHERTNGGAGQRREEEDHDEDAHERHLHPWRDTPETAAGEHVDQNALHGGDAEGDEESGAEYGDGVNSEEAVDDGPLGALASGDERGE